MYDKQVQVKEIRSHLPWIRQWSLSASPELASAKREISRLVLLTADEVWQVDVGLVFARFNILTKLHFIEYLFNLHDVTNSSIHSITARSTIRTTNIRAQLTTQQHPKDTCKATAKRYSKFRQRYSSKESKRACFVYATIGFYLTIISAIE